jgi:hypothetical protein
MIEIIQALDDWTVSQYPTLTRKLFGLCELAKKTAQGSEQPIPAKIHNGTSQREQVSLKDNCDLVTWVRLQNSIQTSQNIEDQNWSFGLQDNPVQSTILRWVVAHKIRLGESWINIFLRHIPKTLTVDGYQIVSIDRGASSIDTDHENIYRTELGETNYEKHRFAWNLYVINLNVECIPCSLSDYRIFDETFDETFD